MPADPSERKRKPRITHAPYKRHAKTTGTNDHNAPKSSVKKPETSRENLTLHDWLTVLRYVESHPDMTQMQVVDYFRCRKEGALIFTQSTLSRKLQEHAALKQRATANPAALSSKRPRVVTNPTVERVLVLWVRSMEQKGETVNGPMLVEKRRRFEERLKVPEVEQLSGNGWVASFCKM